MKASISVIGLGRLGATQAACFAALGHDVIGVDTDPDRVQNLRDGRAPFFEPGLDALITEQLAAGRLHFSTDAAVAGSRADIHFLAVGTPSSSDGHRADTDQLTAATAALAPHLRPRGLVVGKSTAPPGTAERLRSMIRRNAPPGTEPELVWNPEFLREGSAVADCLSPDRVVLGLHPQDVSSEQRLRALYGLATRRSFFVTDYRTAELVKQAANAYLALKISYINAIAELCEQNGADVTMVSDALGADPRIGRGHLDSGIGYGGGCLPKDVRALISVAHEAGAYSLAGMLQAAQATNSARRDHAVARAASVLGPTPQGPIAVLGIAFKADTDDLREAPIVDVVNQLVDLGWEVRVYDPYVTAQRVPSCRAALEPTVSAACAGAQLVLLLGSHRLTGVTPEALGDVVGARRLLTVASRPELDRWRAAGWECIILGASATPHRTDPAVAVPAGSWTGRLPEHQ